jgi:hypothetical protein
MLLQALVGIEILLNSAIEAGNQHNTIHNTAKEPYQVDKALSSRKSVKDYCCSVAFGMLNAV